MGLFSSRKIDEALAERDAQIETLEATGRALQARVEDVQELVRHLDQDRDLLLGALERMRPGAEPLALAEALLDICFKPLGLACFYVALADWEQDQLHFVLYQEGGRTRNHPPRRRRQPAMLARDDGSRIKEPEPNYPYGASPETPAAPAPCL